MHVIVISVEHMQMFIDVTLVVSWCFSSLYNLQLSSSFCSENSALILLGSIMLMCCHFKPLTKMRVHVRSDSTRPFGAPKCCCISDSPPFPAVKVVIILRSFRETVLKK